MPNLELIPDLVLTEEQYAIIETAAASNFSPSQIAIYLGLNKRLFLEQYHLKDSFIREHYDKGILVSQFEINSQLGANARSGNITAAQVFDKAQSKVLFENHKMRILNEG